jgi:hypothetical protein
MGTASQTPANIVPIAPKKQKVLSNFLYIKIQRFCLNVQEPMVKSRYKRKGKKRK